MAVYTHLDDGALRALWSVYDDDDDFVRAEGIPHGSINTTYRLTTGRGVFYLRINEDKTTDDVLYERDVLDVLAGAALGGVVTPVIRRTRVGGSFYLVEKRHGAPVWGEIFPELPGRDLGVFEVNPQHTAQIGAFLARAHVALRGFKATGGGRSNPYRAAVVEGWLARLARVAAVADVAGVLQRALARASARRRLLPRGVVHGDLFVDNTKWHHGDLRAVFDWEMAGRDHLALDVAICVHAWCWHSDRGYDADRCKALLAGYQRVRPLHASEKRGMFWVALVGAVRFTASRLRDFEVPRDRDQGAQRAYLDYRDFLRRLEALEGLGDKGFRNMVGLA